mmetsp:Transcript_6968/g.10201  ORF Transcript_6968/g.10201 Transcript_6968/m.10201 type:complete len:290 (+) Transcript_6968:117-986(+)
MKRIANKVIKRTTSLYQKGGATTSLKCVQQPQQTLLREKWLSTTNILKNQKEEKTEEELRAEAEAARVKELEAKLPADLNLIKYIQQCIPKYVHSVIEDKGQIFITTTSQHLPKVQKFLYLHFNTQAKVLSDIVAADYLRRKRFQVIINHKSSVYAQIFHIKLWVAQNEFVPSSKGLYPSAIWFERECFDMFGISFSGERETRRMLNDYGFKGYPLRKDFPLTGFTEVYYDYRTRSIAYKPSTLIQEYRFFHKRNYWLDAGEHHMTTEKQGFVNSTKFVDQDKIIVRGE